MVMNNRKAWGSYFGTTHNFWHSKRKKLCKELNKTSCWKRGSSQLLGNFSLLALTWTFSTMLSWSPILQAVPKLLFSLLGGISEEPRARIHRTSSLSKNFSWTPQCINTQLHIWHISTKWRTSLHMTFERKDRLITGWLHFPLITFSSHGFLASLQASLMEGTNSVHLHKVRNFQHTASKYSTLPKVNKKLGSL